LLRHFLKEERVQTPTNISSWFHFLGAANWNAQDPIPELQRGSTKAKATHFMYTATHYNTVFECQSRI